MSERKDPALDIPLIRAVYTLSFRLPGPPPTSEEIVDQALGAATSLLNFRVAFRHIDTVSHQLSVSEWLQQHQLDAAVLTAGKEGKLVYAAVYSNVLVVSSKQQSAFKHLRCSALQVAQGKSFSFGHAFFICCAPKLMGRTEYWLDHGERWTTGLCKLATTKLLPQQERFLRLYASDERRSDLVEALMIDSVGLLGAKEREVQVAVGNKDNVERLQGQLQNSEREVKRLGMELETAQGETKKAKLDVQRLTDSQHQTTSSELDRSKQQLAHAQNEKQRLAETFEAEKQTFDAEKQRLTDTFEADKQQLTETFQTERQQLTASFQTERQQLTASFQTEKQQLTDSFKTEKQQLADKCQQYDAEKQTLHSQTQALQQIQQILSQSVPRS